MPVLVRSRLRRPGIVLSSIRRVAGRILTAVGEPDAELSVEMVGDQRICRLNGRYRKRDAPTDVLAFASREAEGPPSPLVAPLLGDVVISVHRARRQGSAHGHSIDREVVLLLIHGILHLCGYDHERGEREARRMRRKEREVLRSLGRVPKLFRAVTRDG